MTLRSSASICSPSSRVGASTSMSGPSPCCSGGCAMMCSRPGMPNAMVLPEPVFATPTMSRPAMAGLQPWDWIAVGEVKPCRAKLSSMNCGKPVSWNERMGFGTLSPETVMLCAARHCATSFSSLASAAARNSLETWPFCSNVSCDQSMSLRFAPRSEKPALGASASPLPKPPLLKPPLPKPPMSPPLPKKPFPKPPLSEPAPLPPLSKPPLPKPFGISFPASGP
mmetsp:Transcript_80389/g.206890  ORF Transcript_80389/g.206890 Transcript_80389/m.206890 type:complete len:225 (-) Transcript_80389:468-1142(-)